MPRPRSNPKLAPALVLAIALLAAPALALDPATPLAGYGRQSWVMENGLPQNTVQALVQTKDGFIWLGTEVGLVRFDGNSFQVFDRNSSPALPGNDVRCLLAAEDGALWIGTSEGLARLKDGELKTFTTKDGLPGNAIRSFGQVQHDGFIVSTENGEIGVKGTALVPVIDDKLEGSPIGYDVVLPDGVHAFASKTRIEMSLNGRNQRWAVGKELPGTRIQLTFADRSSALWIGTNAGLVRWFAGRLDRFPVTDPLATASILAMMEDREGNLWVGTETGGLHILRDQRFRTMGAREGLSLDATTAVVEDKAGALWVGTRGGGLNAFKPGASSPVKTYTVKDGLLSDVILSLAAAPNGELWVGTPDGLSRVRKGRIESFTSADGLPDDFIRSLLADADGSLWIGTRRGLTHWFSPTHMETLTQANGLGSDLVGAMVHDSNADLWVATLAGLSRLNGGKVINYTTANRLPSNVITALLARKSGELLVGTQDRGWTAWNGKAFIEKESFSPDVTSIHAILDDASGKLWFATGNGITRCEPDSAASCSRWIEFGAADGLRSRETATSSHPSAWRSADGRLWFATPKGLVEVDPAHFPINTVPPPVSIVRFAVDDVDQPLHAAPSSIKIAAGHVHFQFDYAGLSFVAPQKVRYRYMLAGFDRGWTEAGTRRAAYYTNIPPGRYTFRVQAANNDGLWNTEGAALSFELQPHFYQTAWFFALMVAAALAMVLLLLRRRLRRAEGEFKAVLAERSRIAREIHDTLAQGYVGISVQLELLAELLRQRRVEDAARQLDTARGYVREGLADARQSIWALRSQDTGQATLPILMRRLVEAENGHGLEANFSIYGAYRTLPPGMEREILRVAQEAVHNVKKHAGAAHLFVQLEYGPKQIALEVRDDGRGFAAGDDAQPPSGHYGLTGMRERAAALGGTLEVVSDQESGTTVRLQAPAPGEAKEQP